MFMKPSQLSIPELIQKLHTNAQMGLNQTQVKTLLQTCGANTLPQAKQSHWILLFLQQFTNPLIYILVAAAVLIFFVGEHILDAFVITGILVFNAIIGTIQERRTHNLLASLKKFVETNSVVIREGKRTIVPDYDLVPGDIILLKEGDRVPADARLIQSNNIQIDEAAFTGESSIVFKDEHQISSSTRITDQKNMVFKGTYIVAGFGTAIVTATGLHTEIGAIHTEIQYIKTDMPLKKDIERLSYLILLFILCVCVMLFVTGLLMHKPVAELLVMLTALFICVVPEGLPVVLTLVLVSGAYRMAKHSVLVKNLQAVETLGRTNVIIIDKTGTLTRNEMIVNQIFVEGKLLPVTGQGYSSDGIVDTGNENSQVLSDSLHTLAVATSLLNTTEINYSPQTRIVTVKGNPTEAALFVLSKKLGVSQKRLETQYHKVYEIPFDPILRYHAGFFEHEGEGHIFVTGSPELLMMRCNNNNAIWSENLTLLLDQGLRMMAVAYKIVPLTSFLEESVSDSRALVHYQKLVEQDLTLVALCAIQDCIRSEVRKVIAQARESGIRIVMATGDNEKTALYVAKQVGLYHTGDVILQGAQLEKLTQEQAREVLPLLSVCSRVSPAEKMKLIMLFKNQGYIVAMTGDGINDAPSLVAADLGIAMGRIGTEVAKEAADLILLDDSFSSIMSAVAQGRHILYTLRRVILYFFATNMGEILIVLFALFTPLPLPLTAVQILWLNLVTDGFLDIALSTEPQEKGILSRYWLARKLKLVDLNLILKMFFIALPMGLVSLAMFWWYYMVEQTGINHARTITLITMAMFQWFNAWNCRSERKSIFALGILTNRWLVAATIWVLMLQLLVVYTAPLQSLFRTVPLSAKDWITVIMVSMPIVALEEIRKAFCNWWWPQERVD
jgi:Ca2+-transporting ATPase